MHSPDILGLGSIGSMGSSDLQLSHSRGLALGQALASGGNPDKLLKGKDAATRMRYEIYKRLEEQGKIKPPAPVVDNTQVLPVYNPQQAQQPYVGAQDLLGMSSQVDPTTAAYMQAQEEALAAEEEAQLAATMGADFNIG
jgi:hypothetical protein